MKTLKDLLGEGKNISLFTPDGFIDISAENAKKIKNGEITSICAHPGCSGADMKVNLEEILNYVLVQGGEVDGVLRYMAEPESYA